MPLSGSSFGGRRGLKSPDPGPFQRKPPKANLTEGFAFAKPSPSRKPPKRLQRKTWMAKRRVKPRRGPWRSAEHRAAVRRLPCCAPNAPRGCSGRITASHLDQGLKEKGMGMKTGDQNCVPHCLKHNLDWGAYAGPFRGWSNERRERYADEATHETMVLTGLRQAA